MQFKVPQFLGREARVVGPFTFKQFIFIGIAFGITVFLYFTLKTKSFFLFLILATLIMGSGFGLALLKPGGVPLPTVMTNIFLFLFKPKIYLWQKRVLPVRISQKEIKPEKKIKEKRELKIIEKSHLRELFTHLETKTK